MRKQVLLGAILAIVHIAGCGGGESGSEEVDPAKLSSFMFGGKPNATLFSPDPYDASREITWEFRNLTRMQTFLAKSCTTSEAPACQALLLGYIEYSLDGGIEIGMRVPTLNAPGTRGDKEEFFDSDDTCVGIYDSDTQEATFYGNCDAETVLVAATLIAMLETEPAVERLEECPEMEIAVKTCIASPTERCRDVLMDHLEHGSAATTCANASYLASLLTRLNCASNTCNGRGPCNDSSGHPVCECVYGYAGARCESLDGSIFPDLRTAECGFRSLGSTIGDTSEFSTHPCAPDKDFSGPDAHFLLEIPDDGYLDLSFEPSQEPGMRVFLYNASLDSCVAGEYRIQTEVQKGEAYYVVVDGPEGHSDDFELNLWCGRQPVMCQGSALYVNDVDYNIEGGSVQIDGNTSNGTRSFNQHPSAYSWDYSAPENVYRLINFPAGKITVKLLEKYENGQAVLGNADLDIFVYHQDCQEPVDAGSNGAFFLNEEGRAYYVVVDGYRGDFGPYNLGIKWKSSP